MAGDLAGCAARKKSKSKSSDNSESDVETKLQKPTITRGGLRVYKIVILGDGGVGKSGNCGDEICLQDGI
jgi:hypothetical protein